MSRRPNPAPGLLTFALIGAALVFAITMIVTVATGAGR